MCTWLRDAISAVPSGFISKVETLPSFIRTGARLNKKKYYELLEHIANLNKNCAHSPLQGLHEKKLFVLRLDELPLRNKKPWVLRGEFSGKNTFRSKKTRWIDS